MRCARRERSLTDAVDVQHFEDPPGFEHEGLRLIVGEEHLAVHGARRRGEPLARRFAQAALPHHASARRLERDNDARHVVHRVVARALTPEHRYLWLDATYHRVRVDGRVISQATVVAVGITSDGTRQIFGVDVGPSEDKAF